MVVGCVDLAPSEFWFRSAAISCERIVFLDGQRRSIRQGDDSFGLFRNPAKPHEKIHLIGLYGDRFFCFSPSKPRDQTFVSLLYVNNGNGHDNGSYDYWMCR